jgi:plasmid stabilization system protein ParE
MPLPVVTSPEADEDIRLVDGWWREHRPAAPDLFVNELAEAFAILGETPEIGHRYPRPGIPSLRRLLLRATRYHVYYVFDGKIAAVLSVWSAVRGRGPRLRR